MREIAISRGLEVPRRKHVKKGRRNVATRETKLRSKAVKTVEERMETTAV